LACFHPETNSVERIYPSVAMPRPQERPGVHAAVMDPDGSLWVIDLDHLLHIDPERSQMEAFRYVDVQPAPAPATAVSKHASGGQRPEPPSDRKLGPGHHHVQQSTCTFSTVKRDTGSRGTCRTSYSPSPRS
ncbi:MAG: hypothetical protein IPP33_08365, partial [Flavobacteriales bacterium]|nr:hypothetical protein [Flavobacteriales bacterium]